MPPVQAGASLPGLDQLAYQIGRFGPTTTSSVNFAARNSAAAETWIVTGIDFTATQAEPVQCFLAAELWINGGTSGPTFYYDSQSTGEGNGVWFSWRGAIPLAPTDAIGIIATSASNIVWGGVIFGVTAALGPYAHE
jgi:hypothetical protein